MTDPAVNPYASPAAQDGERAREAAERGTPKQLALWLGAVAANLPVPAMFAAAVARDSAAIAGAVIGVVTVACVGLAVVWVTPVLGRMATRGGYVVAFSQLFPVGQVIAGMIGLNLASRFGPSALDDDLGPFVEGFSVTFVATLVTAGVLIGAATAVGSLLLLATGRKS